MAIQKMLLGMAWVACLWTSLSAGEADRTRGDGVYGNRSLPEWREFVKSQPLQALGTPETIQGLMEIVADPFAPWTDRRQFALTLGRIGSPAAEAVPLFQKLLKNKDADPTATQLWSLKALGLLGTTAQTAADDVLPFLQDAHQPFLLRATAMETLARIAPDQGTTLTALIELLKSDERSPDSQQANELRRASAEALSLLGPQASPALPELIRALHSDWPILQRSAATALGAMGPRGELAISPLTDLVLFGESNDSREAAAEALGAIGKPALPALTHLLQDEENLVRRLAVRGLGKSVESTAAVKILAAALQDESPVIRVESAEIILLLQPGNALQKEAAIQVLLISLQSTEREVRMTAYRSLQKHADLLTSHHHELQAIASDPQINAQTRLAARRILELAN